MYVFTPQQHCLLSLSVNIWRRLGKAKYHGLRFGEETATELFLLDLAELFPGNVKVVPFNRREEGRIGADWAWVFIGPDGQSWQGMLVQAKRLDDKECEYPELYYVPPAKGPQPSVPQLDRLIDSGRRYGLPPVYVFYNHLSTPGRVPNERCGSLRMISQSMPESWGIAVASALDVRNNKPDKRYDRHREHSLPLHCLLCSEGRGRQSSMGSADAAAAALTRLFDRTGGDDKVEPELTPPFRPRWGDLPDIFQFAEKIHQERIEGAVAHAVDVESDFPGIGGVVILRDSEREDDFAPPEYPAG